jgi:hypothetical protein
MAGAMAGITVMLFVTVVAMTVWGWRSIPDDRRFPISFGVPPGVEGTVGKRAGLVLFLLIGAWMCTLSLFAASGGYATGWIGIGVAAFFLAMEYRLIRRLSR